MHWVQSSAFDGQAMINKAVVARYIAAIGRSVVSSRLEINAAVSTTDLVRALSSGFPPLSTDPEFSVNIPQTVEGTKRWVLIKMERALAKRGRVSESNANNIRSWLKSTYQFYETTAPTATKVFPFETQLLEDGGVSWTFSDPDTGTFPIHVTGGEWDPLRLYLASAARLDMLKMLTVRGGD